MKHKTLYVLPLSIVLFLSSCGVSQKEYDELQSECVSLNQETESLSNQISSLSTQIESLSITNESLVTENESLSAQVESLTEYKASQDMESMNQSYIKDWAVTSFGDNSVCFSDDTGLYLQCVSEKTYSISKDGIIQLWSDYIDSTSLLGVTLTTYPDKINYSRISVKFLDPSGTYILEITMKQQDDSYVFDYLSFNLQYTDTILPALISVVQN